MADCPPGYRCVQIPGDDTIHQFPEAATDAQISAALKAIPAANAPQVPSARTWLDTAKDVAVGALEGATHTALDAASLVRMVPGVSTVTDAIGNAIGGATGKAIYGTSAQPVSGDQSISQARDATAYTNAPQMVGGALETVAELAAPAVRVAGALPTTAKAGQKFEQVMAAARTLPVDVQAPGQVALRIQELAERGGSMPMAVRKFLGRITAPNAGPLTYEEARDFASNISRLSSQEYGRVTPAVAREVASLRATLNQAVAQTASRAGKGREYVEAMNEYARALRIRGVIDEVIGGAKRTVPYATAAGAGYWLSSKLRSLLGD